MLANGMVSASNITEGYNAEPVVWIVGSKGKQFLEIFIRYEYNRSTATAPCCLRDRACEDYEVRPDWLIQPPRARLA